MKQILFALCVLLSTSVLSACSLVQSEKAGLDITSQTEAAVFINNENKGNTPFTTEEIKPGEYDIKLENEEGSWSKKVRIENGTVYYINLKLGKDENTTAGELVYLEKGRGVGVISSPNGAEVSLDGQKQGFTPYLIQNISEGEHEIAIAKDGYESRTIKINAVKGNKIMIEAMLNKLGGSTVSDDEEETTPSASAQPSTSPASSSATSSRPSATPRTSASPAASASSRASSSPASSPRATTTSSSAKGTVTVLETSTGWLRVRDKAGLEGKEVAKINSGDSVEYVEQTDNGWTEIVLEDGSSGFVASRFVKVDR